MFANIGIYIYKFGCFCLVYWHYPVFSMGFTLHKAKNPLATRYGFTRGKEKKKNIEVLSNDQKSQMHSYITLKKMLIVAQRKTIWRYRISQSSYTWKEAIGNFCIATSAANVHISEEKNIYRGWEIMCVCIWHTENRTFSMLTLKKIVHKHWLFLVLHVKFVKNSSRTYSGTLIYM